MHKWKVSEELQSKLKKLSRKNKPLHEQVIKKIDEIIYSGDVEHYKNLRYNMKDSNRIHIDILFWSFNISKKMILSILMILIIMIIFIKNKLFQRI